MLLRADFHMHSHFSPDSVLSPRRMAERCRAVGLTCVAVTDHNSIQGAMAIREFAVDIKVIIGEEVTTADGEVTGLFLEKEIPKGLSAVETCKRIKDQGGVVSVPHPFDRYRTKVISRSALEDIRPFIDIVEAFNARNNRRVDNEKARAFAVEHGYLMTGVTDSHTAMELGRTYTEMPDFDGTPDGFKEALREARIVGRPMTPLIHGVTTVTKVRKKYFMRGKVSGV
ncbi:MAG: PHP domain-containing protein [SAR202 cluster bacterium]|nr:PHP domain-containing protein [SAR202 cluster bacterium]